ncbi:MAG TPA: serine/threonine-protein kinase [Kofleriaceae bacterium]|nr:serine/threonine-protein kinase [Kofleriaceae bacterium]
MLPFADPLMPASRERLLGPYRLLEPLGSGATAELFIAEKTGEPGSRLVVKRLLPALRHHGEAVDLFLQEAALALRCATHPNVGRAVDHGRDGDEYFLALEYVEGVDLGVLLDTRPKLGTDDPGAATRILLDVCDALGHVHQRGVIHRDLTPRNLIVGRDGLTRLIDFGVAVPEPIEGSGHPNRGTWAYMSPEQVRGDAMDRRSDVFSLGVLVWELYTSRRLFKRAQHYLTMAAVVDDPVPPLGDPELDRLAQCALAKHRDDRFAEVAEVAEALRAIATARDWSTSATSVAALVTPS